MTTFFIVWKYCQYLVPHDQGKLVETLSEDLISPSALQREFSLMKGTKYQDVKGTESPRENIQCLKSDYFHYF